VAGGQGIEVAEHLPELIAAAEHRRGSPRRPQPGDPYSVPMAEPDVTERRGDLLGHVQLGRTAKTHRFAGVDQRVEVQIFLFQEHLQEQLVESSVEVPVDQPQVIAGDVIAEIGELHALALALAPPLAFHPAAEHFARHQFQPLELAEQRWRKEFGGGWRHRQIEG